MPLNAETGAQLVGNWLGYDWHFEDNVQVDDVKPSWEASIRQDKGRYHLQLRMPQDESRTMTLVGDLTDGVIHLETHLDLHLPTLELSEDGSLTFMSQYLHLRLKRPRSNALDRPGEPSALAMLGGEWAGAFDAFPNLRMSITTDTGVVSAVVYWNNGEVRERFMGQLLGNNRLLLTGTGGRSSSTVSLELSADGSSLTGQFRSYAGGTGPVAMKRLGR